MIDVLLLLIFAGVTWTVSAEGPYGAALVLIGIVLSGLLAMNLFEPAANMMESVMDSYEWQNRWDIITFLGLFSLGVFGWRDATERIMPTSLQVAGLVHESRWLFGAAAGYAMMASLLTAMHTAPLGRTFIGFKPERSNLFDSLAPDMQWLGFTQYVSERVMRAGPNGPVFDGAVYSPILGDPSDSTLSPEHRKRIEESVTIWSSFPIRYAQRRDLYAGTPSGAAGPATTSGPPAGGPPSTAAPPSPGAPAF